MNPLPRSCHDKKETQDRVRANPPAYTRGLFPESKLHAVNKIRGRLWFEACISARNHSDSRVKKSKGLKGGEKGCHLDKTALNQSILPLVFLFLQDGNVHLKTSLLYCSYITQLSALLSGRQVPIEPLIYGA